MRSLVCAQCHVEYYFKGEGKIVTYPWSQGLKVEQMEEHYNKEGYSDWTHAGSGAKVLKAQHPEFELWSQGIHARSGVSCADCHMPYVRDGAIKVSNHHVRSPLLNVAQACQGCHRVPEAEITARALLVQDRNKALLTRSALWPKGFLGCGCEICGLNPIDQGEGFLPLRGERQQPRGVEG
jgi:nitrite reductase (cytochrome c-552)